MTVVAWVLVGSTTWISLKSSPSSKGVVWAVEDLAGLVVAVSPVVLDSVRMEVPVADNEEGVSIHHKDSRTEMGFFLLHDSPLGALSRICRYNPS